jgi:hypothetical protein
MSERKSILLRIDSRLFEILKKWAADDLRSINAEIEYLLTEAVKEAHRFPPGGSSKEESVS